MRSGPGESQKAGAWGRGDLSRLCPIHPTIHPIFSHLPPFSFPLSRRRLERELAAIEAEIAECDAALAERTARTAALRARLADGGTGSAPARTTSAVVGGGGGGGGGGLGGGPLPGPGRRPASPTGSGLSSPWGTDVSDDEEL
jgi:hypothetical protein